MSNDKIKKTPVPAKISARGVMDDLEVPEFLDGMLELVRDKGLRSLSLTAMCFLERLSKGKATMTELAVRAKVSVSAVHPQLVILQRLGLVERVAPGLGDLREKVWRITDFGIELLLNKCQLKKSK